jgi:hypothetical protein
MKVLSLVEFGNKFQKRAAIFAALFFIPILMPIISLAAPARETYRDLIEKAYNLSLQKDRTQAVGILLSAIKKENKKSPAQKELLAAIEKVSKVFYSDKSQQLYELALSMKSTDPGTALSKLQEAARLEPDNLSIEMALARQSLSINDCDAALTRTMKQKDLYMAVEELRLAAAQADVCLAKYEDFQVLRNAQETKKSELSTFWNSLEAEYLFKTGAFQKSMEIAVNLQKQDNSFPEAHYWEWRTGTELKLKVDKAAQRYLSLCKTINSRLQRQYLPEPQLCRRTTEIETFLKKTNNSEI